MYPNLMGTTGFELYFQQAIIAKGSQQPVMSTSWATIRHNCHPQPISRITANWCINSARLWRSPDNQRQVQFAHTTSLLLGDQVAHSMIVTSDDQ
jgi:hypothetical protein